MIGGVVFPVSAGATILAPKVITCPVDGKKFTVQVIASTNFQGMDRDLRKRTTGTSFYEVIVWTCPGNYYSGYRGDFAVKLDEALKKKIREELRPRVKLGLIDLGPFRIGSSSIWAKYELAARVFEWRGEPETKIAHAYLRASYFLKSPEAKVGQGPDGPLDRRSLLTEMRLKAAIWFMLAFDLKKEEGKGLGSLAYIVGELHRRTGRFQDALVWFDRAASFGNAAPPWLQKWIAEQRLLAAAGDLCECDNGPQKK